MMLRNISRALRSLTISKTQIINPSKKLSTSHTLTDQEIDSKYIKYFDKTNIDSWEIRQGINDLIHSDLIPEPSVVVSIMKACRRLNDYALTVRLLEAVKYKCGRDLNIYEYVIQEIRPILNELGISTPEEMGFDQPEFLVEDPVYQD